jgi:hypothetical protein
MTTSSTVISIVPRLPPSIDGVGDYALSLAQQLRQLFEVNTIFLTTDSKPLVQSNVDGFSIRQLKHRSSEHLFQELSQNHPNITNVLVQYANYGYDRWGCPFWLVSGLQKWQERTLKAKLIMMFHELHNNTVGPPWKHGFWAVPQQKRIAGQLAEISNHTVTNAKRYAKSLEQWSNKQNINIHPVFSNIAEPEFKSLSQRERNLVVFGQGRRINAYEKSAAFINRICQALGIRKIIDIGPKLDLNISELFDVPIEVLGESPPEIISEVLLNSWVGFINYSHDPITKSSVFSTYCAHGLIPIVHQADIAPEDMLVSGENYWNVDQQLIDGKLLDQSHVIAENAHSWYETYSSKQSSSKLFFELISN